MSRSRRWTRPNLSDQFCEVISSQHVRPTVSPAHVTHSSRGLRGGVPHDDQAYPPLLGSASSTARLGIVHRVGIVNAQALSQGGRQCGLGAAWLARLTWRAPIRVRWLM